VELIWGKDTSHWYLSDIVGKPPEWFAFDADNCLVLKTKNCDFEKLPPNKFILLTHRSSYENPYGQKALSKCFWPVVFKRSGFQWWTTFVEKYGGAFAFGTYPLAFEKMKDDLLEMLSKIISDGVAAIPEGSNVEIIEATGKAGSSQVFKDYIEMANEEISKSILGQTLTTETSKHGNLATATVHNIVREDLVVSDKKRIAGAYNKIFAILTHINFLEAKPPRFEFFEEEDVKKEKADRDKVIFDMGFRFSEEYLVREYGYQEGDLKEEAPEEKPETKGKEFFKYFHKRLKNRFPDKSSVFDRILSFFNRLKHSAEEKKMIRDHKIIDQYKKSRALNLQNEVDRLIDRIFASIDQGKSLESVRVLIIKDYPKLDFSEINRIITGVRYVASQAGAYSEGVKSKKKTSR
jgi:phage gp29-like protein